MKIDHDTVEFKSIYPYYGWELSGEKSNTVRVIPRPMLRRVLHSKRIRLVNGAKSFERTITNAVNITEVVADALPEDTVLVCISWSSTEGVHP